MQFIVTKYFSHFCTLKLPPVTTLLDPLKKSFTITLFNNPQRNVLSSATEILLEKSLSQAQDLIEKSLIRSVWIKSTGPVFSAGHDLKQLRDSTDPSSLFSRGASLCLSLRNLKAPVICIVDGLVAGAGCQLVVSCDLIIASQASQFVIPAIKAGLFPTTPSVLLSRLINNQKSLMGVLMLGEALTAEQAYRFGLVTRVVTREDLQKAEEELVQKIGRLSAEVLALGKQQFYRQSGQGDLGKAYAIAVKAMGDNLGLKDCQEGLKAFTEKRQPQFNRK